MLEKTWWQAASIHCWQSTDGNNSFNEMAHGTNSLECPSLFPYPDVFNLGQIRLKQLDISGRALYRQDN